MDLFLNWDSTTKPNTILVDALTSPSTELNLAQPSPDRLRRISAPTVQLPETVLNEFEEASGLWMLQESEEPPPTVESGSCNTSDEKYIERQKLLDGIIKTSMTLSQSLDNMNQLKDSSEEESRKIIQAGLMSLRSPQGYVWCICNVKITVFTYCPSACYYMVAVAIQDFYI